MEKVVTAAWLRSVYKGKRVFLTGHTGFKGAWLMQILHWLGADVKGYSLAPQNSQDLFNTIRADSCCYASVIANIRDLHALQGEMVRFQPDFVFHLAAQSLVRRSYEQPVETFAVNTMGTVNVLEAMRALSKPAVGLMITTDKVYENPESGRPFQEDDKLGGYDPYSASKAAAEIVIDSYRRSFFHTGQYSRHQKSIASARAGNVIGGGDWSEDRLVPDIVRALDRGEEVVLRNPTAVRPWQHVLEPLGAYLYLAGRMSLEPTRFCRAFNFGPAPTDERTVENLVSCFLQAYGRPGSYHSRPPGDAVHEAHLLTLDSSMAEKMLGWHPVLNADEAIRWTAEWYADKTQNAYEKCMNQIKAYFGT
jgi:CDP-glucose 4,6-dehydratase